MLKMKKEQSGKGREGDEKKQSIRRERARRKRPKMGEKRG